MNVLKNAIASGKTTAGGLIAGIMIIIDQLQLMFDGDPSTVVDYNAIAAAVGIVWLGLNSRDADKSSEDHKE